MITERDIRFHSRSDEFGTILTGEIPLAYNFALPPGTGVEYIQEARKLIAAKMLEGIYGEINKAIGDVAATHTRREKFRRGRISSNTLLPHYLRA